MEEEQKLRSLPMLLSKNDITDKSKVLMIGDREHDVVGAHENGLDCLGILYGFGSRKEFEEAGADYIRENVEDNFTIRIKNLFANINLEKIIICQRHARATFRWQRYVSDQKTVAKYRPAPEYLYGLFLCLILYF